MIAGSFRIGRALFGFELDGSMPVRYVYLDEAGTAAHEPITVEAGVIVKPDAVWKGIDAKIADIVSRLVPDEFRAGFVFHAKELFNGGRYRPRWPLADRLEVIKAFAAIPSEFDLPICVGTMRRTAPEKADDRLDQLRLKPQEWDHCFAFLCCVAAADTYLRENTPEDEVAHLAVEDCDRMRTFLDKTYQALHEYPSTFNGISYVDGKAQPSRPVDFKVSKFVDGPHFVGKARAPMLQLADACAFIFRRYMSEQSHADQLMEALLGPGGPWPLDPLKKPSSMGIYVPTRVRARFNPTGRIRYF